MCEKLDIFSAPLAPRILEKCLASDRIVIDTVVSTYCSHTRLHRQSVILEWDLGLRASSATVALAFIDSSEVGICWRNNLSSLYVS
jgi:hypothetical protein